MASSSPPAPPSAAVLRPRAVRNGSITLTCPASSSSAGPSSASTAAGSNTSGRGRARAKSAPLSPLAEVGATLPTDEERAEGTDGLGALGSSEPRQQQSAGGGLLQVPPVAAAGGERRGRLRALSSSAASVLSAPFTSSSSSRPLEADQRSLSGRSLRSRFTPRPRDEASKEEGEEEGKEYPSQVADVLDVIDPEVSTLQTLNDVQNSLFVPDLGGWVRRGYKVRLGRVPKEEQRPLSSSSSSSTSSLSLGIDASSTTAIAPSDAPHSSTTKAKGKFYVIPEEYCASWEGWTDEEREELDDYVRHLMHSRKWKLRRAWRGFKKFTSTPLGAFVTIYSFLLGFWGTAWFLFLVGWIGAGERQKYFIEICDQILVALFCVVGIGMAPFRTIDTYHMIYIAHYHRTILRLYRERATLPIADPNDLPLERRDSVPGSIDEERELQRDLEAARTPHVLTEEQEQKFLKHQTKFAKSHTFYRPHETATHKAFPLDLMIVVVCLLDFHSIFQIALGSVTWSISYHQEFKHKLTAVILSFSITCNVTAGLVITVGNRKTRKTEVVEERLRQAITEEAIRRKAAKAQKAAGLPVQAPAAAGFKLEKTQSRVEEKAKLMVEDGEAAQEAKERDEEEKGIDLMQSRLEGELGIPK